MTPVGALIKSAEITSDQVLIQGCPAKRAATGLTHVQTIGACNSAASCLLGEVCFVSAKVTPSRGWLVPLRL